MATLYRSRGDLDKAESYYQKSLAILKETLGDGHPRYGANLAGLADVYQARADYRKAEDYYRQALAIYKKSSGAGHPVYADTLEEFALASIAAGNPKQGVERSEEALQAIRRLMELTAAAQSERQQLATLEKFRKYLNGYLSLTVRSATPAEQVYPHVLAWKGAVSARQHLLHGLRHATKDAGNAADVSKLLDELEHATRALATAARAVYDPNKAEEHLRETQRLSDEVERLERELAGRSEEFRKQYQEGRRTPEEIRKALPAGTVLVDVVEYKYYDPPARGTDKPSWSGRYVAFIVTRDKPVERIELGPAEPIAKAVDDWRKTFGVHAAGAATSPAAELRQLVWEPLVPSLKSAKTVLVSPDGALDRFPFAALPGREAETYLIEDVSIAIVPLPNMLPELFAEQAQPAGEPSLLLVGEVSFDGVPGSSDELASSVARSAPRGPSMESTIKWKPLPATRAEVLAIKDSFQRRFRRGRVTELREEEPTETEVRKQSPEHRFLHFATHGFFAPPAVRSALAGPVKAEDRCPCSLFSKKDVTGFHPGLLSGLVLAGANRPVQTDRDDGILTALEVEELDLAGVELATLSACETGLGESAGGEGLLGLQRAFQLAGARSVVASLWQLQDDAARALMIDFYENLWRKKMSKLEALRQAQLTMLREGVKRGLVPADDKPAGEKKRLPPYYWAAFELSGDWR